MGSQVAREKKYEIMNIRFDKCKPVMLLLLADMGQQLRVRVKRKRRARQEKRQKAAAKAASK